MVLLQPAIRSYIHAVNVSKNICFVRDQDTNLQLTLATNN